MEIDGPCITEKLVSAMSVRQEERARTFLQELASGAAEQRLAQTIMTERARDDHPGPEFVGKVEYGISNRFAVRRSQVDLTFDLMLHEIFLNQGGRKLTPVLIDRQDMDRLHGFEHRHRAVQAR